MKTRLLCFQSSQCRQHDDYWKFIQGRRELIKLSLSRFWKLDFFLRKFVNRILFNSFAKCAFDFVLLNRWTMDGGRRRRTRSFRFDVKREYTHDVCTHDVWFPIQFAANTWHVRRPTVDAAWALRLFDWPFCRMNEKRNLIKLFLYQILKSHHPESCGSWHGLIFP